MQVLKKAICMFTAIITLLTSTPVIALCEEGISALNQPYSFSYEDDTLSVEAKISRDTVFTAENETIKNDQIHLEAETDIPDVFSELTEELGGELLTVDLSYRDENDTQVQQTEGSTVLTLTIPMDDENAYINDVEVFRCTESDDTEGEIQRIEEITVNDQEQTVEFDAGELGTYAVRYTVDYRYDDQEYHMAGGSKILLSELFNQLSIKLNAADVVSIEFTDDTLLTFSRLEDNSDWMIESLSPFDTEEKMTVTFSDGYILNIFVTDEEEDSYRESTVLEDFMTGWKIVIGDVVFSDDTVDENTVIEYKPGMQYSLELNFAEQMNLGFATPETNVPEMYYQIPDCFVVPPDYQVALSVNLGKKGVLADNIISVENKLGTDGEYHDFLKLRWNWEDTLHWNFFRDSSQAKLKIIINGTFADISPNVLSINGKDVMIRREDLHNALVNKTGIYNPQTGVIDYTVTVSSQGTTSDITLTDTLGSALTYLTDEAHNGGVVYNANESTNSQNTVPQITQKTGNTFNVNIPAMADGDALVFNYSAQVNYDMIAVSGNPSFEETGNTAEVFGDSYTLDNKAIYHETNIEFSDLEKNVLNKARVSIAGNPAYIITWEIETNKRAQYPLADTDITDTISPVVQNISKYYGDGVTVKCYSLDGSLAVTRNMTWEELGVDLANDVSWSYHIPDTDPMYRYVLTYDTIVYMDGITETIVAENTAEGKGGIDSDRAVLPPPGVGGFGVTKKAIYQDSTHVTWEITLTVSGDALDSTDICLTEHSGTNSDGTSWSTNNDLKNIMPAKWIRTPDDSGSGAWYKETLKRVEIDGLENSETYKVMYSTGKDTLGSYYPAEGSNVCEANFQGYKWSGDQCQIWLYKDAARTQGGLIKPDGEEPTRTIVIRLYNEFPAEWATAARDYALFSNTRDSSVYSHINWVSVDTPGPNGMSTRAKDTDKFMIMPPHVSKAQLETTDTTLSTAKPDKYILNYHDPIIQSGSTTDSGANEKYKDAVIYPTFRFQVLVSGIKYDEPLVIEDTFDTSLFDVIAASPEFPGGRYVMTKGSKQWTHGYFCKVVGMNDYGWSPSTGVDNYNGVDPRFILYGFGFDNRNYYRKAEDFGCELEKTDTGFRVTINNLFKRQDGSLYPLYGIDYYIVPKSVEALKRIEEMARANALAGGEPKATFINTASVKGVSSSAKIKIGITNDFMPISKTSETYLDLVNPYNGQFRLKLDETKVDGQTVRKTPEGITSNDIQRYVMKYSIVLNKGKERLNDGNFITAEDEYSSNLALDFTSIKINTDPEEALSQVSYDFSNNIGYFTFPDETKVSIEYEAVILQNTSGLVKTSNEVRMLQYKKALDDYVDHGGAGGSSAFNPAIRVKKYASGHMESGLDGAVFRLYEYNYPTYTRGDPNTAADWTPVTCPKRNNSYAEFTTAELKHGTGEDEVSYGHGYAEIELKQDQDGLTLQQGKVYGIREIVTPVGVADNKDIIQYKNPHNDSFFCYIFTICQDDQTADYTNFVYMADDTMTIRNNPESIALHMQKQLEGNCTLTDAEKNKLTYQVFLKQKPTEDAAAVYMPVMTTKTDPDTGEEIDVIDERFTDIKYSKIAVNNGIDITGMTVESGASVGEYLLVEYGNSEIMAAHPDWSWRGSYKWNDGGEGSFTNSTYTVYDENGQNPQTVNGIAFIVTSQEVSDGDNKAVVITNTYNTETLTLTARKRWIAPSGSSITWPSSKSVVFELGTLDNDGGFTALPNVRRVTLDNVKDSSGEETAGSAVFRDLPKYAVIGNSLQEIKYAVREVAAVTGYNIVYPISGKDYAEFDASRETTIKNQMESTGISVSKAWDRGQIPAGASATFRLYSYTGLDPSTAVWVSNVNDITLDGITDTGANTFGEITPWRADFTGLPQTSGDGQTIHYIVKELRCSPTGYEAVQEYAADGGTITNKPASVTFTVSKIWLGTQNNAWPNGARITLTLERKSREGAVDSSFSASYTVANDTVIAQDTIVDPYGDARETGNMSGGTLTVADLPKYDSDGNEWLYYITETAIQTDDGSDLSGNYTVSYRDKNNYYQSGMTYSGGSIINTLSTRQLTLSKTVTGNMGDMTKGFRFTIVLRSSETSYYSGNVDYSRINQSGAEAAGTLEFVDGTAEVTLAHNESITLIDLPGGLRYTVSENANDAGDYNTSYAVNGSTAVNGREAAGTLASNPVVAFTNSKQVMIPSGVYDLSVNLYALIPPLLLGMTMFRKRKDED